MSNKKITSHPVASLASHILHDKNASGTAKSLAGSALSQVNKGNETGKTLEKLASEVLQSNKYSTETKELAGSVLSQSDKKR
jgi:hypothetical protein